MNWKVYTDAVPKDCTVIGHCVTIGASDTGALMQMAGTMSFLKVNAGKVAAMLNQRATTATSKRINGK